MQLADSQDCLSNPPGPSNAHVVSYVAQGGSGALLAMANPSEALCSENGVPFHPLLSGFLTRCHFFVQALARDFLKDPIQVYVGSTDVKASHHILQLIEFVEEHEKHRLLVGILATESTSLYAYLCRTFHRLSM